MNIKVGDIYYCVRNINMPAPSVKNNSFIAKGEKVEILIVGDPKQIFNVKVRSLKTGNTTWGNVIGYDRDVYHFVKNYKAYRTLYEENNESL